MFTAPVELHREANRIKEMSTFKLLDGGQFSLSTQLMVPNFCVSLPHRRSTRSSLEAEPFYSFICYIEKKVPTQR